MRRGVGPPLGARGAVVEPEGRAGLGASSDDAGEGGVVGVVEDVAVGGDEVVAGRRRLRAAAVTTLAWLPWWGSLSASTARGVLAPRARATAAESGREHRAEGVGPEQDARAAVLDEQGDAAAVGHGGVLGPSAASAMRCRSSSGARTSDLQPRERAPCSGFPEGGWTTSRARRHQALGRGREDGDRGPVGHGDLDVSRPSAPVSMGPRRRPRSRAGACRRVRRTPPAVGGRLARRLAEERGDDVLALVDAPGAARRRRAGGCAR